MTSIDEDARKRFEADWQAGDSLPIKAYLPDSSSATYLGTLEELVCIDLEFRWTQSQQSIETFGGTAADDQASVPTKVEDYVKEFPELDDPTIIKRLIEQEIYVRQNVGDSVESSEYKSRFPAIHVNESLFSVDPHETAIQQLSKAVEVELPYQFGPYLLTGQLGRGGMGAVYRAKQLAADREVALKIADTSAMNSYVREMVCKRFEIEAHAAAALEHDNVVPIYDVGFIDDLPYYAMRLVAGGDLSSMARESALEARRSAGYIRGVARGLMAAHAAGMLHRDIKPQNILVDEANDRAMITDFGLARFTEEDSGVTQSGQMLGTPSFMPPEQIRDASKIDERADVYSLGGTLYFLLTGRPPFKAASMQETLQQVLNDEPVSARRMNSAVPVELDTVCLKCLEKDPAGRYQSAQELAEDLDLFLAGKPIRSKPASMATKVVKWCRRNQRLAASLATTIVSTVALIVALSVGLITISQQRNEQALLAGLAIDDIDQLYSWLNEEPLLRQPGVEAARKRVLEGSLKHYGEIENFCVDKQHLSFERAVALTAIGANSLELGTDPATIKKQFETALDLLDSKLEKPEEEQRKNRRFQVRSNALRGLGVISRMNGDYGRAREYFQRCSVEREAWVKAEPESLEPRRKFANAIMNEGMLLRALAMEDVSLLDEAYEKQNRAQSLRAELFKEFENEPRLLRDLAQGSFNLAFLSLSAGDFESAVMHLRDSVEKFDAATAVNQTDFDLWRKYAESRIYLADQIIDQLAVVVDGTEAKQEATDLIAAALSDLRALVSLTDSSAEGYSLQLISLYQDGIDALIYMQRAVSENEQVGFLALAEDEWNHLDREYFQKLNSDEIAIPQQLFMLRAAKQEASLSALLDAPETAVEKISQVIEKFEQYEQLVAEAGLDEDLQMLKALLADSQASESQSQPH